MFLTILLSCLIIPACALAASDAPAEAQTSNRYGFLFVIGTFLIGYFTGMAEILSRYRDEPWKASFHMQGLLYMAVNGGISIGAYFVVINYNVFPIVNGPGFPAAIVSGFSAMAIFRSKIFIYRSPEGKEYPIGPDLILGIFMGTIDRQIDRSQAFRRQELISTEMTEIGDFEKAAGYFDIALLAFQNLTDEERAKFKDDVDKLQKTSLPQEVKNLALGYALLNLTGEDNFKKSVDELKKFLNNNAPISIPQP